MSITDVVARRSSRSARITTELGAPWVVNIVTSILAGAVIGAPWWGVFGAAVTGGVPILVILIGVWRGMADDHHVPDVKDRRWVIPAILAIVAAGIVVEVVAGAPEQMVGWLAAAVAVLVGVGVITVLGGWKISVHTAVSAGTTVLLALISSPWWLLALPATAVIGWSRVRLRDHTRAQVTLGALLGSVLAAATYLVVTGLI
ncbi:MULTISPECIES: hypothetical protein [unclassified Nocardia]|uniref:hypothetical protein n=1 Tax=unclassified Nocardia TaxID=2637762 RepID=UPI00278BAE17|nr:MULTISPECIES: hypothetical protein [unclassified Nocardia]